MVDLYKIILIDDEDEVRGRISSKISKESGFEVVATAGNGYDALELIEQHQPHVVLTDIKMPFIDGMELARIIRRDFPTIKIGFITGFDQLDYAKEAIQLNACTYLTKPLTQEDISSFLIGLKEALDLEYEENYNRELIEKRYQQNLPLLIDNGFVSVISSGKEASEADIDQLRHYGVSLDDSLYLVAYVRVQRNFEHWGIIDFEKLKLSVRSRLNTTLSQFSFDYYSFTFLDGIIYVIKERQSEFERETELILNRMIKTSDHYLSVHIDIGVSLLHKGFSKLGLAYEQAETALSVSKFGTESRVFFYNESQIKNKEIVVFKDAYTRQLEQLLRYEEEASIEQFLTNLKNTAQTQASTNTLNLYALNLVRLVANYAAENSLDINELAGVDVLEILPKMRSFDQLFSWIMSLIQKIRMSSIASRMNNAERMLEQAINYMHIHYTNPTITMETVCDELGISISYMSQLFKKHKDTSFVKLLTSIRMEKAIKLLRMSGDRIAEIASQCGYQDVYYFSHSFKKYTGVSPKKYREETE